MNNAPPHSVRADLARDLAQARWSGTFVDAKRMDILENEMQAYGVQQLAGEIFPSRQLGYKIGATSEQAQKIIGCSEPFYGQIFARDCYKNGANLSFHTSIFALEAEFAFQLGYNFEPQALREAPAKILDAVASCHIALEMVGRRTTGEGLPGLFSAIADFGANCGFIIGAKIPQWREMDLSNIAVSGLKNGETVATGTSAAVLGNPLHALEWLANRLAQDNIVFQPGDWISTGTCFGIVEAKANSMIEADFGALGKVAVSFHR